MALPAEQPSAVAVPSAAAPDHHAPLIRVLFAVQQGPLSPGPRYRVLQYVPYLSRVGFLPTVLEMQGARSTRRSIHSAHAGRPGRLFHAAWQLAESALLSARLLRLAPRYDRIYLYRVPLSPTVARLLRRYRAGILFDLDDAWDAPEGDGSIMARLRRRVLTGSLERAVSISSVVVVSNERNAEVVRKIGGRAAVVPTTIDLERAVCRDRSAATSGPTVLGWIGTPSTARYLALIESALRRVVEERSVVVRLIGSGGNPFCALEADVRDWSYETEAAEIAKFDIGLMPMPDTQWTRGKAALKALQYGASGAPTVASWTPTNEAILGTDQGAILCRTDDEWVRECERLVDDPQLRGVIGRKARRIVEERYSLQVHAPCLAELIRNPVTFRAGSAAGLP